jgi:hypothetical protein
MMGGMSKHARDRFDARGAKTERLSEYFNADRGQLPVKRFELQAILDRIEQVREARKFRKRLWKFLVRPFGSGPAVIAPTTGEIERGEIADESPRAEP